MRFDDFPLNNCLLSHVTCSFSFYYWMDFDVCQLSVIQVAYVLGQLQNKAASAALSSILRNASEHPMVRHEAAEALGSIAGKIM